LTALLQVN